MPIHQHIDASSRRVSSPDTAVSSWLTCPHIAFGNNHFFRIQHTSIPSHPLSSTPHPPTRVQTTPAATTAVKLLYLLLGRPRVHHPHDCHAIRHTRHMLHRAVQHARSSSDGAPQSDVVAHRKSGRIGAGHASFAEHAALVEPATKPFFCCCSCIERHSYRKRWGRKYGVCNEGLWFSSVGFGAVSWMRAIQRARAVSPGRLVGCTRARIPHTKLSESSIFMITVVDGTARRRRKRARRGKRDLEASAAVVVTLPLLHVRL